MKNILLDPGSAADRLYFPALIQRSYKLDNLCNPRRVLVGFNDMQTHSLREIVIVLLISTSPIIALVPLSMIDESSSFNAILGCT